LSALHMDHFRQSDLRKTRSDPCIFCLSQCTRCRSAATLISFISSKPIGDDAARNPVFLHDLLEKFERRSLVPLRSDLKPV
jgi:hypothetical protein